MRRELLWFPLVLLALAVVYLPGLGNLPIFDDALLTSGTVFKEHGDLLQPKPRMLSYGTFVWLQDLVGEGWWKQRLFNLALHVGVVFALWGFYREILRHIQAPAAEAAPAGAGGYRDSPALGLAIGFFALNPVAVYAVAYLIQRSILMATLFVVLGLWLVARGLAGGKWWYHLLAAVCYVLAVMSKEHAVMAPLAVVPLYILVARPPARRLAMIAMAGAGFMLLAGGLLYVNYGEIIGKPFDQFSRIYLAQLAALGPDVERNAFPLSIVNQTWFFFKYALHWFLPYAGWMSIDLRPPFPVTLLSFPQVLGVLGYAGVLAGGLFLLVRYRDWRALVGISLLLPAILFVTEFSTVWVQDPFVLYRSYLWAIGLPGLVFFLVHGTPPKVVLGIGAVLAILLAWQGLDRVQSMSSQEALWTDAIAKQPDDPRSVGRWFPYLTLGNIYFEQNRLDEAVRYFRASAALGDRGMGVYNLGAVFFLAGKYPQALGALDEAVKQGYDFPGLHYQRGAVLHGLRQLPEAYRELEAAQRAEPGRTERVEILVLKGKVAMEMGDTGSAVRDLEAAVRIRPRHGKARITLGMAYVLRGEHARAEALLSGILAEKENGPAYYGRALANYGLKRKAEALADIENALRLSPDNPNLSMWRDKIRAMR